MRARFITAIELPVINGVNDWDTAHWFLSETDIVHKQLAKSYLDVESDFAMRLKNVISSNGLNHSDFVFKRLLAFPESDVPCTRAKERFLLKQISDFSANSDEWLSNVLSRKDNLILLFKLSLRIIINLEIRSKNIRLVPASDGFRYVAYTPNDFPLESYFVGGQFKYKISDMI